MFADEVESADDGGFGAMTFACDLGRTEEFDAIEAEDLGDGRRRAAAAGIELFKEGEGGMGDIGLGKVARRAERLKWGRRRFGVGGEGAEDVHGTVSELMS